VKSLNAVLTGMRSEDKRAVSSNVAETHVNIAVLHMITCSQTTNTIQVNNRRNAKV